MKKRKCVRCAVMSGPAARRRIFMYGFPQVSSVGIRRASASRGGGSTAFGRGGGDASPRNSTVQMAHFLFFISRP